MSVANAADTGTSASLFARAGCLGEFVQARITVLIINNSMMFQLR